MILSCKGWARLALFAGTMMMLTAPLARAADSDAGLRVARLAREVEKAEAVRAVKNLQNSYNQYSQFGLWDEMAHLFAANGEAIYDKDDVKGPAAIRNYFLTKMGGGQNGLKPGVLHTQMLFEQEVNVSADGRTAQGRWRELSMLGNFGGTAEWTSGIMENDFVKENSVWKIARIHYAPQMAGPYATGWHDVVPDLKVTPYHFTPDQAGTPVPPSPDDAGLTDVKDTPAQAAARLTMLNDRVNALNDEDMLHNLQNIYGYYADRKMWDDVTDLFTSDGVIELGNVGIYKGIKGIRRALEKDGPAGLKHGELNDHVEFDAVVTVMPGGEEAHARGFDLGVLGDVDHGQKAYWSFAVFDNRYVKGKDGIWRIREMRIFPVMKTDFYQGWAKSQIVDPAPKPDAPLPSADVPSGDLVTIPVFFSPNPVTGKKVRAPAGMQIVGTGDLLGPIVTDDPPAITAANLEAAFVEVKRKLAVSIGYDAVENLATSFGYWIADKQYDDLGNLFAPKGLRQYPVAGSYRGPARIAELEKVRNGLLESPRKSIGPHIMAQPVIYVSPDGRSAKYRTRNFQLTSDLDRPGTIGGGSYSNNQAVLVNGIWKIWSIAIDEFYWQGNLVDGWSRWVPRSMGHTKLDTVFLPDISRRVLGKREEGIAGGPGKDIEWPDIKPMWFFYKNPVSGRTPPNYWPDCVTCVYDPSTSMKANGY